MSLTLKFLIHHHSHYRLYCRGGRLGLHLHRLAIELQLKNI